MKPLGRPGIPTLKRNLLEMEPLLLKSSRKSWLPSWNGGTPGLGQATDWGWGPGYSTSGRKEHQTSSDLCGHTQNVPGSFISSSYHMWCLPKAEVHKSHSEGRPLSVAYSFLLLLIEGIVGFYSCDHLRQRSLVTEHVNFHFFP